MEHSACAECGHETAVDHLIEYGDATICVFCAEDNHSYFGPSSSEVME